MPASAIPSNLTAVGTTLYFSAYTKAMGYQLWQTDGTAAGQPTPQALVATNDQAVGGLVDYLSHTSQWSSTAVFVMEDDSQDGLDHRDGHRNILLVASPYVRHGVISHVHISQAEVAVNQLATAYVAEAARSAHLPVAGDAAVHGVHPCAGDDEWCVISLRNDDDRAALAAVTGGAEVSEWTSSRDKTVVADALQARVTIG